MVRQLPMISVAQGALERRKRSVRKVLESESGIMAGNLLDILCEEVLEHGIYCKRVRSRVQH